MYEVIMPKLSDSMEEGKIIEWKVKEGDQVSEGDILAEVESDKAVMELECFHEGVVAKIVHGNDAEVPVGEPIAYLTGKGGEAEAPEKEQKPAGKEAEATPAAGAKAPEKPEAGEEAGQKWEAAPARSDADIAISPYARKLAREKDVDFTKLHGTGPAGRIIARDVEAAAKGEAAAEKPGGREEEPASAHKPDAEPMGRALIGRYDLDASAIGGTGAGGHITVDDILAARKAEGAPLTTPSPDEELPELEISEGEADIENASFRQKTQARRVTAAKHVIPHFYITHGADVTRLIEGKDEFREKFDATVTHLVMLAALKALKRHAEINHSYDRGRIIKWKGVHLGLAVATDEGLTVAVLRDAQDLSLAEIVKRTKTLVEKARAGRLSAAERRHPTFTITNLGMFDVENFEPVINPPSSVTLAISSALPSAVIRDGAIMVGKVMKLTLSCDHRMVDGVAAARFLHDLKSLLENPEELLEGE